MLLLYIISLKIDCLKIFEVRFDAVFDRVYGKSICIHKYERDDAVALCLTISNIDTV